ncbi:MAG TPA: FtsX-like permease family protein [Flavitalea sp.]|nr:FtsX-like permease family protein [Flavitalea sp.]
MFFTNIKIAWRNLLKTKGYAVINIGGLSVGIAITMLIGLWLWDELSYNKSHENFDHIAQVMTRGNFNGQRFSDRSLAMPLEKVLRNTYGNQFRHIVLSRYDEDNILTFGDIKVMQSGRFMQEEAPEMLSLNMIKGTRGGLHDLSSILLSASAAKALFGNIEPLGQTVLISNNMNVKVTGVYEDIAYNSEFSKLKFICPFELVVSKTPWMQQAKDNFGNTSFLIYVQIADNRDFASVDKVIKNAIRNNAENDIKKFNIEPFLDPMKRWHLYSDWKDGVNNGGRIQFVWLFAIIGIFVLLLACINFMNLSTARSEKRAREVGVRKAIGSGRGQLISQFLTESFVVVIIAYALSLVLVWLSLKAFNDLSDKRMTIPWSNIHFWWVSAVFILFTSVIAGSYPAFYLSSFHPVKVLKGTFRLGRWSAVPRKVLVVVQFTVSVALIIGTIIVYRQVLHAKNRPVGYDRNGLLAIPVRSDEVMKKFELLSLQLKEQGVVSEISTSSSPLTAVWSNYGDVKWRGKNPNQINSFGVIWVSHDYGKTVGWNFKDGRDFSRMYTLDSVSMQSPVGPVYSMVVNEAAARYMNFDKPLGEIVEIGGYKLKIIGVIRDMLMESPFDPVRQTIYMVNCNEANAVMHVRLNPDISVSDGLAKMEKTFRQLVPSLPFEYNFADTDYALKFAAEERIGKIAGVFASLAIFISCLGLFGLASFVAEKRTKEIGIRKILGATVFNVWRMLSVDFVVLIVISCGIAIPVAYYFLDKWLQQYQYRTSISWWIFAVAIFGAILLTILTVSFQAIKAAVSNPVKSLRTE